MKKGKITDKRHKYVEGIIKEFTSKGWDTTPLTKAFNKSTLSTQKGYDKYKRLVAEQRRYNKEREKVHVDYLKYVEKRNKERDYRQKKKLAEYYGKGSEEIKQIWSERKVLGLTNADFNSFDRVQKRVANKFQKDFTSQLTYFDKNGETGKVGALFKYHKDDRQVALNLKELNELMLKDKNAVTNARYLIDYVYEKLIPLYYEQQGDEPPIYGKDKKAEPKFFTEVSRKMLEEYKKRLR